MVPDARAQRDRPEADPTSNAAPPAGFEPATKSLEVTRSVQLSYRGRGPLWAIPVMGQCGLGTDAGMTTFGYTLMTEQSGPRELVGHAAAAEEAGFDFEVISDHYFPWLDAMGHASYAWSVLGAVTQVTRQVELMTYVTCPLMRYHPAVVAQKAATVDLLSDGRFTLGLGAGENLNEHVVGRG